MSRAVHRTRCASPGPRGGAPALSEDVQNIYSVLGQDGLRLQKYFLDPATLSILPSEA
jgi:hypothetical protein